MLMLCEWLSFSFGWRFNAEIGSISFLHMDLATFTSSDIIYLLAGNHVPWIIHYLLCACMACVSRVMKSRKGKF